MSSSGKGDKRRGHAVADPGEGQQAHLSNLSHDEAIEPGTTIGALLGPGIEDGEGMEAHAAADAAQAAKEGINMFGGDEWDALEDISNDSAACPVGRPPAADRRPHCPGQCQQRESTSRHRRY